MTATRQLRAVLPPGTGRDQGINQLTFAWTVFAAMPAILDLPREAAAIGLLALVVFPIIAVWITRQTLIAADPIVVIGAMWLFAASFPILVPWLYKDAIWLKISDQAFNSATLWMYRAWAACSLGYWTVKILPAPRRRPASPSQLTRADKLRIAIGVAGLIANIVFVIRTGSQSYSHLEGFASVSTLDQIVQELSQLSKIYIFLFFYARGRGRLTDREYWLLYATLTVYLFIFGARASKGVAVELVAMWVLGNAASTLPRRNLAKEIVFGVIILTLIYWSFMWVTAYRFELQETVTGPAVSFEAAIDTQIGAAGRALNKLVAGEPIGSANNAYDSASMLDRLGYVSSFAMLLDITGGNSPYENAVQSFLTPLYGVLPRDVFDEKVRFFDSAAFAQMLGWNFGGFSVTLPASLYWAWGFEGIVPAMFVLGAALALLGRRSASEGVDGTFARVVLTTIVLLLLNVGIQFQPIIIGATRVVFFTIILYMAVALLSPDTRVHRMVRRPPPI